MAHALSDQTAKESILIGRKLLGSQMYPGTLWKVPAPCLCHDEECSHDGVYFFGSHQLCLAPGDAVAGDAAEVTLSGDFDFGPGLALLLILRCLHHQETIREVLLRAHLHIHADTNHIDICIYI